MQFVFQVEKHINEFDFVNMVTVLYKCAKANPVMVKKIIYEDGFENALFHRLLEKIASNLHPSNANPRSLANLSWSIGKLNIEVDEHQILIPMQRLITEQVQKRICSIEQSVPTFLVLVLKNPLFLLHF